MLMKLNNKGFAISTILYGLSVLILVLLTLLIKIMTTDNSNSKYYTDTIKKEIDACSTEAQAYNSCYGVDNCKNKFKEYAYCYCSKIYKDTNNCKCTPSICNDADLKSVYDIMFPNS